MIIKQNPHLAGAAEAARALPDFRNLGVVLRILLLVNGLAVVAVLLRNADVRLLGGELLDMAMRVEFPLILSVALLFLLQPRLAGLPAVAGWLAVATAVGAGAVFSHLLLAPADGSPARGWAGRWRRRCACWFTFAATWRPASRRWPRRASWR